MKPLSDTVEHRSPTPWQWLVLAFLLALVFGVAAVGSLVTAPRIPTWYAQLAKPSFNPPSWLFGPVWTALYLAMALAAWRVCRAAASAPARRWALTLFGVQLALNALWSPVFFGWESPRSALAVIVLMWVAIAVCLAAFWRIDRPAGALLVPYLAWVSFAAVLNGAIVVLNPAT